MEILELNTAEDKKQLVKRVASVVIKAYEKRPDADVLLVSSRDVGGGTTITWDQVADELELFGIKFDAPWGFYYLDKQIIIV